MREDDTSVWTYIFMIILVAGIQLFFKDFQAKQHYKNTSSHERETYDSAVQEIDSLLVTFKK